MKIFVAIAALAALAGASSASVSYTGGTYSQGFDSLGTSGSLAWANDSTLAGWSLFRQPAPGTPVTTYTGGDGSSNAGAFYSFGTGSNTDRALGGVGSGGSYFGSPSSGNIAGWFAVALTNSTAGTIDSFTVGYDGEQWRNGGNTTAQTMVMEYGFGASFTGVASWIAGGSGFNFTSLVNTSTAGALDGNAGANRTAGLGGTVSGLSWGAGQTLWIRWVERNDSGNDHGLAIDNFEFSAVPTPGAAALLGLGGLLSARRRR